ncbi:MAG: hypothetical protein WA705_29650 [Candidatus Ozemobacteraceae bacterium]
MTKEQEIDALKAFIKSIPRDSYIVPMLIAAMPVIESDIKSDFEPDLQGFINGLQRQKEELEQQIKTLQKDIITGNEAVKKQQSEAAYLARQSDQLRKQLRGLQDGLKTVLQW